MDRGIVALVVVAVASLALLAQAWNSWLEHRRRAQAMDVIKAALEAGKDPPPALYELLAEPPAAQRPPWTEAVVFSALGIGFWIAYFVSAAEERAPFLVIAASMSVTAIGCLALAVFRPGQSRRRRDDELQ